ncbi:MAG: cytochrome B [Betaproteobacteria bacterium]|nr:cytochrome B [Betaproteobacteria bacterium]
MLAGLRLFAESFLMIQVRIWDLPTRIFHWSLALLIIAMVVTGNVGGNAMIWHFRCGYAIASLLIFRFLWGFTGGHWSRWTQLRCTPSALLHYFSSKAKSPPFLGHNPVGSLSVVAMLGLLSLQVGTGLFSDDEISNAGPLVSLASESYVNLATYWHKSFGKTIILILVVTHILAIAWYFFKKKENLTRAMLNGNKPSSDAAISSKDSPIDWLKAFVLLLVSAGLVYVLINMGSGAP